LFIKRNLKEAFDVDPKCERPKFAKVMAKFCGVPVDDANGSKAVWCLIASSDLEVGQISIVGEQVEGLLVSELNFSWSLLSTGPRTCWISPLVHG
jgi:hypothetical protein